VGYQNVGLISVPARLSSPIAKAGRVSILITIQGLHDKLATQEESPYFCLSQSDTQEHLSFVIM
jgi:hypothetical protein